MDGPLKCCAPSRAAIAIVKDAMGNAQCTKDVHKAVGIPLAESINDGDTTSRGAQRLLSK